MNLMHDKGGDVFASRQLKLQRLREKGIDPYPPRFHKSHTNKQARELYLKSNQSSEEHATTLDDVTLAGRIMALRTMGKSAFADIRDGTDKLQILMRRDVLGANYDILKDLDIGDIIGVGGSLTQTRTGEITLQANHITILTKSMRPLPEKWHGLRDIEQRYRQRYLDLIANNEDVTPIFQKRSQILESIRRFFNNRGYIEVDTPILVPVAAGALARPFITHHKALDRELYMRIATELYLKRLIIGGFDKVYEIGKMFRNEGIDATHNPEFTTLESYEAYSDYNNIMELVETLISDVAQEVLGTTAIKYREDTIDLSPPWKRLTYCEAIHQYSGIDLQPFLEGQKDTNQLIIEARDRGIMVDKGPPHQVYDKILSLSVEPNLVQPTFITDHPLIMSPLAKQKYDNPLLVERFEGFIGAMEIANSFTELNDPQEQRHRFQLQENIRAEFADEETDRTDEDFLTALEYGMPPTGGLGIGIDRIVMLLTGQTSIRDVIFFPQMRGPD
ncbi:lysine--tRNA ligase [SAR202 cluster bacterium AC-409-J13_OGT_754m]|nr:lysine--tRNA ligase [SAR202 cluster bacterium AC-409-J13_OGT_754m]